MVVMYRFAASRHMRGGTVSLILLLWTLPLAKNAAGADPTAPAPIAQRQPEIATIASRGPAVAAQAGVSGLARTAEGEVSWPWGLVGGVGIHGGRFVPTRPTARLAYDYIGSSPRWHLRVGVRFYPFAEGSCDPCAFLVPEIGVRFVGSSGFVFEIGVPIARVNLNRVSEGGLRAGLSSDGYNMFLLSLLVGFSHQF